MKTVAFQLLFVHANCLMHAHCQDAEPSTSTRASTNELLSTPLGIQTVKRAKGLVISTYRAFSSTSAFRTLPPTIPPDQRYPPKGPPVITGYQLGQKPQNGDTLVCTVTGGAPLVHIVDFRCAIPLIPDQPDDINQTSVSSNVTFNTPQNSSESIVCVCLAFWDEDPTRYNLTASVVFHPPEPSSLKGPDISASDVPTYVNSISSSISEYSVSTVPPTTPWDVSPTSKEEKGPAEKEEEESFLVAVVAACIAGCIFLIILIRVLVVIKRRGQLSCLKRESRVEKTTNVNSANTDTLSTHAGHEQLAATDNILELATPSQHGATSVNESRDEIQTEAGDRTTNPRIVVRTLRDIAISPSDGEYAELDFQEINNPNVHPYTKLSFAVNKESEPEDETMSAVFGATKVEVSFTQPSQDSKDSFCICMRVDYARPSTNSCESVT